MIVKTPFLWSTSGYNSPAVRVTDSVIPVAAGLCRASIGTPAWMGSTARATDTSFPVYWPQWDEAHLPRCAYHFLKNGAGGADQAKHFVACVNRAGGFHKGDRVCIDVEDSQGGISIAEVMDCIWNVHVLVPFIPFEDYLIYSRENIMNPLSLTKLTQGERDILLKINQWTAGYPNFPDTLTYEQLEDWYHFDYAKYGPCAIVQYAGAAVVEGLSKPGYLSIECNVADPIYLSRWQMETAEYHGGVVTPPPGGQMLYGKVNVTLNVRNGSGATYTIIGSLLNGDLVTASETRLVRNAAGVDVAWWHLTDATRNGQPVTLADGITIKARAEGAGDVWASSGNGGYIAAVEPPPAGEPVLTHTIEVFDDGSVRIDGAPV